MPRIFLTLGAINAFLCVLLGALGAHGLKHTLTTDMLVIFQTGRAISFLPCARAYLSWIGIINQFITIATIEIVRLVDVYWHRIIFRHALRHECHRNTWTGHNRAIRRSFLHECMAVVCLCGMDRKIKKVASAN